MFQADNPNFQYTGRIDFSNPKRPTFSAPGVYIQARFRGTSCAVAIHDEVLWGTSHNYVELVIDNGTPMRVQTTGADNLFPVTGLADGTHTLTVCKDTESGIGALEFVGLQCAALLPPPALPKRKLEFIGDSITCGASSDLSEKPCGQGPWYDQHNAYMSYGPTTARALGARWQVTAVSGIGLQHSCCDMKLTMPDVFDKMNLRTNAQPWDFSRYQPDAVTICLGQNDGAGDPAAFEAAYLRLIGQVRKAYPHAQIVCLTSPMGNAELTAWLKDRLTHVVAQENAQGDKNVHAFFFSRSYNGGCGGHPDVAQHQQIAQELSAGLRPILGW